MSNSLDGPGLRGGSGLDVTFACLGLATSLCPLKADTLRPVRNFGSENRTLSFACRGGRAVPPERTFQDPPAAPLNRRAIPHGYQAWNFEPATIVRKGNGWLMRFRQQVCCTSRLTLRAPEVFRCVSNCSKVGAIVEKTIVPMATFMRALLHAGSPACGPYWESLPPTRTLGATTVAGAFDDTVSSDPLPRRSAVQRDLNSSTNALIRRYRRLKG